MNPNTERYVSWITRYLPAVFLLPLLTTPLPTRYHTLREVAGYFQSLAIARDPIASYTYLTPVESLSALHLHSLLSAPLVALGYYEGGRLVSLLAAVAATTAIYKLTVELFNERTAILSPLGLWIHPMFVRQAWAFQPETLSIAFTTTAVWLMVRYHRTGVSRWYLLSTIVFIVGIAIHMWEATILLPLFVVLLYRREWRRAGMLIGLGFGSAGTVWWLTDLQPAGAEDLASWSISNPDVSLVFTEFFWMRYLNEPSLVFTAVGVTVPLAIIALAGWAVRAIQTRGLVPLLLAAWLASALPPVVLLPIKYVQSGSYHVWGLLVPLAVTLAIVAEYSMDGRIVRGVIRPATVRTAVLVGLLMTSAALIGHAEYGIGKEAQSPHEAALASESMEAVHAGLEAREYRPKNAPEVAFIGEWQDKYGLTDSTRVLIYARALPKEIRWGRGTNESAEIANQTEPIESCTVWIQDDQSTLAVGPC